MANELEVNQTSASTENSSEEASKENDRDSSPTTSIEEGDHLQNENEEQFSGSDDEESFSEEGDERESTRWKEGDEIQMVRVRFPGNSRSFPFLVGKRYFSYGQKVVAMSDRGMDVGYINSFPYTVKFKKTMLPIRSISKVADQDDILAMQGDIDRQREAEKVAVRLIEDLKLDMQVTHVEIIQFGKKMVFYFTAPARVDFRELVKRLVSELKMRIELRQISVRDRAAALGSIGACGQATCCSTFLKNYGNVSIKMAKNQNLALIPSKINGVCGQIKCCIKYEDDVYSDKRKLLPKEGIFVQAANGDKGKVTKLHILVEQFDMITEKGQIRRYAKTQFHQGKKLDKSYKFPDSFSHVVNETSNVIGLTEHEEEMANNFNKGLSEDEIAMRNVNSLNDTENEEGLFDNLKENIKIDSGDESAESDNSTEDSSDKGSDSDERTSNSDENGEQKKRRSNRNRNNNRRNKNKKNPSNRSEQSDQSKGDGNQENKSRPKRNRRPRNRKPKQDGGGSKE